MTRALKMAGLGLLMLGAFLLGRLTSPSPGEVMASEASSPPALRPVASATREAPELEQLRERVKAAEERARAEKATADTALQTLAEESRARSAAEALARLAQVPPGAEHPLPFPSGAPSAQQPGGFRSVAEAAVAQCGMGVRLGEVDCNEYPCIAILRRGETPPAARFSPGECAPWHEAFGDMTMVNMQFEEDGGLKAMAWMPVPTGPERPAAMFRARERVRRGLAAP